MQRCDSHKKLKNKNYVKLEHRSAKARCKTWAFCKMGFFACSILTQTKWLSSPFRRDPMCGIMCLCQGPNLLRCLADPVGCYVAGAFNVGHLVMLSLSRSTRESLVSLVICRVFGTFTIDDSPS